MSNKVFKVALDGLKRELNRGSFHHVNDTGKFHEVSKEMTDAILYHINKLEQQLVEQSEALTQKDEIIKILTEAVEFVNNSFVPDKVIERCEQALEKVKRIKND